MSFTLLDQARDDLAEIARYIAAESGDRQTAILFVKRLLDKSRDLANQPFKMGRLRSELGKEIRSYAFGNYVLFFRYSNESLEVITIIEGHRDIDALF